MAAANHVARAERKFLLIKLLNRKGKRTRTTTFGMHMGGDAVVVRVKAKRSCKGPTPYDVKASAVRRIHYPLIATPAMSLHIMQVRLSARF